MFAYLSLTTPAMLAGLLLVALPILAHLLFRHARRKIVFPAIRLLQQSVASQSRLYRLRRWVLLLLRALAVALIVAAFARPVWLNLAPAQAASARDELGLVLLVDASGSTAQDAGGVKLAHQLRAAAQRYLGSLSSGSDSANVVYATSQPAASYPRLSRNFSLLNDELGRHEAGMSRADLGAALARAGQQLAKHEGLRRLVILSDLQQSNWGEVVTRPDAAQLLPQNTQVVIHDVDTEVAHNAALSAPRQFPLQPLVDQPFQLIVEVTNFASVGKQVPVEMTIGALVTSKQTVTLAGNEQREVAFEASLSEPGEYPIRFGIPADGLEIDNQAFLVVETKRQLPVLLVSDDDPDQPATASYFLSRSLAPYGGADDRFDVRHRRSVQVTPDALHPFACVFLLETADLSVDTARAICEYVRQGGGLVLFCGPDSMQPAILRLESAAGDAGLLPWIPGAGRNPGEADGALSIDGGRWRSRLLKQFDEQSQIALRQVRFSRLRGVDRQRPESQDLLTFSDGTPALSSRGFGSGQVVLANWSPHPSASDFGKHGSFVALMQGLAHQLHGDATAVRGAVAGEPLRYPTTFALPDDAGLEVVGPGGRPSRFIANRDGDRFSVEIRNPEQAGLYEIRNNGDLLATAAVNVDPRESDLARIDRQALSACFEQAGVGVAVEPDHDWEPLAPASGRPLWPWCLLAAMGCVALELLCVGLWRR